MTSDDDCRYPAIRQVPQPPPDVSVIIPVYNCERYLAETLDSVFNQGLPTERLEIIAVDDGSTDASLSILNSSAQHHLNMVVDSIPNSGSASAPRNRGLDLATGRYVFFLDADDKLADGTLIRLIDVGDETGSGVVLCKLGSFGPAKRASALPSRAFKKTQFAVDFIDSKAYTTLGVLKLFRRSVLEQHQIRFPLGYSVGEDQPFAMLAYFYSPHVSILSDKIYYWARGRDDGTNVTSIGQSAPQHFLKIKRLIEVIASFNLTPERRDLLLERPTVGSAGFRTVFGKQYLTMFDRAKREDVVRELCKTAGPFMSHSLRAKGSSESQIMSELICRSDVDELEALSRLQTQNQAIPILFDTVLQQFVYRPKTGPAIKNLSLSIEPFLTQISCHGETLNFKGTVMLPGSTLSPDRVNVVWRHRRSGHEFTAQASVDSQYLAERGFCTEFSSTLQLDSLNLSSEWDVFIEAQWGACSIRERFGRSKGKGIPTHPVFIGTPAFAVVFYTGFGNLSVDVGPTRKYSKDLGSCNPQIVGSFSISWRLAIIIEGNLTNFVAVEIATGNGSKPVPAKLYQLTESCVAVVLPFRIRAASLYSIRLIDAAGNATLVTDTRTFER